MKNSNNLIDKYLNERSDWKKYSRNTRNYINRLEDAIKKDPTNVTQLLYDTFLEVFQDGFDKGKEVALRGNK